MAKLTRDARETGVFSECRIVRPHLDEEREFSHANLVVSSLRFFVRWHRDTDRWQVCGCLLIIAPHNGVRCHRI